MLDLLCYCVSRITCHDYEGFTFCVFTNYTRGELQ